MSSRKESLKKSLGITEYPWSSEDEEDTSSAQDVMQRTDREPRPSVADMPGTSGVQPQEDPASPGTSRRIQARMDRDLFWSIINNTPRPTNNSNIQPSRSRATVPPMYPTARPTPQRSRMDNNTEQRTSTRRPERQHTSVDIQRILAFKKLTRSLHNLAQSKAAASTPQRGSASSHTPPRGSRPHDRVGPTRPGPSQVPPRPSLFTPGFQMNRGGFNYIPPWRRPTFPRLFPGPLPGSNEPLVPPVYNPPTEPVEPVEPWHFGPPQPTPPTTCNIPELPTSSDLPDLPTTSELPDLPTYSNIPSINDDGIAVPLPIIEKIEPPDEPNENPEEEVVEEPVHNETGSGARLIEEVVEVEMPDAPEGIPPPPGTDHGEETPVAPAENNTSGETANSEDNTGTPQDASYRGMKRKRDSTDESNELFSVQEFNQSLLRLLECPVCLEWMEPPISQCRRGHLVCSRCRARLAACPVCRTPFSSVRNRAMEGVAEMLRYPCRHGCGREVRLRRRAPHEASCGSRRYHCPAPPCARHPPLQRDELAHHFQCKHLPILKIGNKHKFSMKVNSEQHDTWLIMAMDEYFHLRVDVDIRTWGVIVYVAYIGPKKNASHFTYEVTVEGQHNSRKLVYTRGTHSDLESSSLNVSRQDCFHLTLDQALNFLRFKNRHCEPDKFLDFDVEITKWKFLDESKEDSDS